MTQSELGHRLGKPQSVISRWERGQAIPSLETVRAAVQACGLELSFHLSRLDDSNYTVVDDHIRMTPQERFNDLMERVRFDDQLAKLHSRVRQTDAL